MSEPERIPEWARDEAGRIALSSEDRDADIIADTAERSLMEAYRRGREDAAKCCDRRAALRIGGDEDPMARAMNRLASAEAAECAREIRAGGA